MSLFETRAEVKEGKSPRATRSKARVVSLPIEQLHRLECKACPLDKVRGNKHPHMEPTGVDDPDVYMLGEAPGEQEDDEGEQFIGKTGRLLRSHIPRDKKDKLRWNNCVRTRPPSNRTPTQMEMECCRPSLIRDIEMAKPKAIFGFGNIPLTWALGVTGIMAWRGRHAPIKVGKHVCWFFPMLHPSFVSRSRFSKGKGIDAVTGEEWERVFRIDLLTAFKLVKELPKPEVHDKKNAYDGVEEVLDIDRLREVFERLLKEDVLGIDIETSRIRPYEKGAKILSCAISNWDWTPVFPVMHKENKYGQLFQEELCKFLLEYEGTFVAHSSAFEMEWFGVKLDPKILRVADWQDTMQQAYILDERMGGTQKLDSLCLLHLGLPIKSLNAVDLTKLEFEPLKKLLPYNSLDAKYVLPLHDIQIELIEESGLGPIYEEQMRRVPAIVLTQMRGMCVDFKTNKKFKEEVGNKIEKVRADIQVLPCVKEYKKEYGEFSPTSTANVSKMLREVLKDTSGQKGEKFSTSADVLEQIDHPFAESILELRSLSKLYSTYIEILDEVTGTVVYLDGKVHCTFNTTFASTGRTSSDHPNMQNFPKRKNAEIRSQFVASPGNFLVAVDQGQIEARGIAMESKDEVLVKALWDRYDIHQAWAERIAELNDKTWYACDKDMKKLRHRAKNELVFPAFYGSEKDPIARSLELSKRAADTIYGEFWEMFKGVRKWQKKLIEFYLEHGYVQAMTGRRRRAPLSKNMIINSPIQGLASDIVVYGMSSVSEKAMEEDRPELQPILNIHDDLTFDIPESKLEQSIEDIVRCTLDVPWEFINVPLQVEVSVGPNWFDLKEVGRFFSDEVLQSK
jgi:DNA polymerase-1